MALRLIYLMFSKLLRGMVLLARFDAAKEIEILVLRHRLGVLQRRTPRQPMSWTDRAMITALSRRLPVRRRLGLVVTPSTVLRWHRHLVARRWTAHPGRPGPPAIPAGVRALIIRLATENPTWGYRRIHGELADLGYQIGASTVWKLLNRTGIDPHIAAAAYSWQARSLRSTVCGTGTGAGHLGHRHRSRDHGRVGPIGAVQRLLAEHRLRIDDVDVVEFNEAFAAQVLAVGRVVGIDLDDQLKSHGGSIALGHPYGMTGLRLIAALLNNLETSGGRLGLVTLCVGGGKGMALLLERLS